jgi:hypothetical protein
MDKLCLHRIRPDMQNAEIILVGTYSKTNKFINL